MKPLILEIVPIVQVTLVSVEGIVSTINIAFTCLVHSGVERQCGFLNQISRLHCSQ